MAVPATFSIANARVLRVHISFLCQLARAPSEMERRRFFHQ